MHPEFRLCMAAGRRRQHGNGIGSGMGTGKRRVDKQRGGERKGKERKEESAMPMSASCYDA